MQVFLGWGGIINGLEKVLSRGRFPSVFPVFLSPCYGSGKLL